MNRIKELRTKYNLTLRELERYTGIGFSRLAKIEKTDANVETKTLEKLCSFFKVSSEYLMGKDGFISYYDEHNKRYFGMLYEQYKNSLTDDVVSSSIVDNCVKRIISLEGYKRIDEYDSIVNKALEVRLITNHYIEWLDKLDDFEFKRQKELIQDYFSAREGKENIKKLNEIFKC